MKTMIILNGVETEVPAYEVVHVDQFTHEPVVTVLEPVLPEGHWVDITSFSDKYKNYLTGSEELE
jgi:hypothetical protein